MLLLFICLLSQFLLFLNSLVFFATGRETAKLTEWVLVKILGVRLFLDNKAPVLDKRVKMIFCNHRSFADFFIDSLVIGRISHLSRLAVAFVLPISALYGVLTGRVLYFRRDRRDRQGLAKKIARHLKDFASPLVIYPEGHRNTSSKTLPLKPGVIKIAWEGGYLIQCVLSSNKEKILSEKSFSASIGEKVFFTRSTVIDPRNYSDFESFFEAVKEVWQLSWQRLSTLSLSNTQQFEPIISMPKPKERSWVYGPVKAAMLTLALALLRFR